MRTRHCVYTTLIERVAHVYVLSTLCNLVMSATHRQIEADIPLWHYVSLLFCYLIQLLVV